VTSAFDPEVDVDAAAIALASAGYEFCGALAEPVTAYVYDWNLLPIGQALWPKELQT
jgi:hypothetical protein